MTRLANYKYPNAAAWDYDGFARYSCNYNFRQKMLNSHSTRSLNQPFFLVWSNESIAFQWSNFSRRNDDKKLYARMLLLRPYNLFFLVLTKIFFVLWKVRKITIPQKQTKLLQSIGLILGNEKKNTTSFRHTSSSSGVGINKTATYGSNLFKHRDYTLSLLLLFNDIKLMWILPSV